MMVVMTTDIHRAIFYEVIVAESIAKIEGPLCFHYSHTVASNSQSSTAVVESSDDVTSPFSTPGHCTCWHHGRFKASDIMPTLISAQ